MDEQTIVVYGIIAIGVFIGLARNDKRRNVIECWFAAVGWPITITVKIVQKLDS